MSLNLPPLHTQNPLDRFSTRADDYAKYRPSYPATALDYILEGLGSPAQLTVADIGAGTGISSRLFADRGITVWAVEPNAAMQEAALPHPQVQFYTGTAEQTSLPDRSVDLVVCCQSFHWFEPNASLQEFHRILKPGGRVALMWNDRHREDAFTKEYNQLIQQAADAACFERVDRKASEANELARHALFTGFRSHDFPNLHALDLAGLIGYAASTSYTPKTGESYQQLLANLTALYDRWTTPAGNTVALSYRTHVFLAEACP